MGRFDGGAAARGIFLTRLRVRSTDSIRTGLDHGPAPAKLHLVSATTEEKAMTFAGECAALLHGELRAVLVHREPDIESEARTTVLVVSHVTPRMLREVGALAQRWRRRGLAVPILLDEEDIATSRDVFPLEILMLAASCELVWGESNPLTGCEIDKEHLRLEVEQQVKGKVLHLRQAFLEAGGDGRSLRTLMLDSSAGFEAIMRGLLTLAGRECGRDGDSIPAEIEATLDVSLATFRRIQTARHMRKEPPLDEADELFRLYLEELTALARAADRITRP